ncbi:MAG: putative membrane protein YfcA, partial [Gammaproteobacteria bacterium]
PLFMVGVTIGKHLFTKLPSVWFKRVALGLLLTTGLVMLSRW